MGRGQVGERADGSTMGRERVWGANGPGGGANVSHEGARTSSDGRGRVHVGRGRVGRGRLVGYK